MLMADDGTGFWNMLGEVGKDFADGLPQGSLTFIYALVFSLMCSESLQSRDGLKGTEGKTEAGKASVQKEQSQLWRGQAGRS